MTTQPIAAIERRRHGAIWRFTRNPLAMTASIVLLLIILASVFAPVLAPHDPSRAVLELTNAPPGGTFLLGGDGAGRDIVSRLIFSGRLTLLGVLITDCVAAVIGVTFGLLAGYFGGILDNVSGWLANFLIVLPGTLVLVSLFTIIGPNILLSMAVLGVLIAPNFFRVTRNQVIAVKNELYVDAAKVSGLSNARIIGRHILSVVRGPIIILFATVGGIAIVVQAGLEFIGLGDPATPTWGGMLQDAFTNMFVAPLAFLPPGLAIGVTVASFILVGNGVRDALNDTAPPKRRAPRVPAGAAVEPAQTAPHPTDALLSVRDLEVGYQTADGDHVTVVHGVSFDIARGEVFGLVGESGSGKTQIVLSVLGLLPRGGAVEAGSIRLAGTDLRSLSASERRSILGRRIGYIPQEPMSNLDPAFTIGRQLVEPLRSVAGLSRSEARKRSLDLLARVGITDPERVFRSYPHQVSGGMAQRVLIAGAISCDPDLLVADEMTTALDVTVQAEILDLVRDIQIERGLSVLLVTHNFGVVADLCDTVTVMKDGLILEHQSAAGLFGSPQHPYTRGLLDSTLEGAPLREPLDSDAETAQISGGAR
ncbi:ABC transporter [Leifsonia sp. Root227]|uniref:dipeptide/oligopeptide/nickel ABC transporter permease/ATP-binding protein n=1 Tax=Leifsonia sp. Root227 TaxID=1736496 RepID=UPI0006F6762C|nr:dipeptide/oligopeptide/nickel ABC transporter permease/ATP-binding protein [Leifsonia sp. Root227]KRC51747.1 ABC transporter [Leifsonia sp. Root227]